MAATSNIVDALIIGGGPGGLTTANSLGQLNYQCIVFDSGEYRNQRSDHMHNVLGWDHQSPSALRAKAKEDILARYETITFETATISSVSKKANGHFEAVSEDGRVWTGKKLVLAAGAKDLFPDIEGYADCWGYGIFVCLFCAGLKDYKINTAGVLVTPGPWTPMIVKYSYQARRFAETVTFYTNGSAELAEVVRKGLEGDKGAEAGNILIDERPIARMSRGTEKSEVVLTFADGTSKTEAFIAHRPLTKPNGPFVEQLGLELGQFGEIAMKSPYNDASVHGVFAAGDIATPLMAVSTAQFMGLAAAGGVSSQLGEEEAKGISK